MRDLEKLLASARRTEPSADLDRRIEQALSAAPVGGAWARPVTLWKAAAALALVAAAAFAGGRLSASGAPDAAANAPTVLIIQGGSGGAVSAFDPPRRSGELLGSPEDVQIRIVQPGRQGGAI